LSSISQQSLQRINHR